MATFIDLYGTLLDRELSSIDTVLFTTERRKVAVNEAMQEFVRLTGCTIAVAEVALLHNIAEYDLDTSLLNDFLWLAKDGVVVVKVSGTVSTYYTGDDFVRRDIPWLDRYSRGWRSASSGTPQVYYLRDRQGRLYLGLTPPPSITGTDTMTALVSYVCKPQSLVEDTDEPFSMVVPGATGDKNAPAYLSPFHQGLVHFAAARLEALRRNYQAYDREMQLFNTYVTSYLQKDRRPGGQHVLLARDYLGEVSSRRVSGIASDWWMR